MYQKLSRIFSFFWITLMFISFISLTAVTVIYMAKHNDYFNTLNLYLRISREFSSKLMFLKISQSTLIVLINLLSLLFLFSSFSFACKFFKFAYNKTCNWLIYTSLVLLFVEGIIYHPSVHQLFYLNLNSTKITPQKINIFYEYAHKFTFFYNCILLLASIILVFLAAIKCAKLTKLRFIAPLMSFTFTIVCVIYFYFFSELPDTLLWISKVAGYIRFKSLPIGGYTRMFSIIIFCALLGLVALLISFINYNNRTKRLQQQKKYFEKFADSNIFTSRVFSHYIKNEILSIAIQLENCKTDLTPEMLQKTIDYCNHIYEHIDHIKKINSIQNFEFSYKNLYIPVLKSIEDFKHIHPEIHITVHLKPPIPTCKIDILYLEEVFNNLLKNAYEAMQTLPEKEKKIRIYSEFNSDTILIHFENPGTRIPKSDLAKLFDPFYSTKPTQTNWGIGLYICKKVINSHNGDIFVSSSDKSTVFTIELPLL